MPNFYQFVAAAAVAGALVGAVWPISHAEQSPRGTVYQAENLDDAAAYYSNVDGKRVHRPMFSAQRPPGATAQCADGSWSFSLHRRGTCNYHGGVLRWL
jgi:Protein of unknown function (DUF3761)